MDLAFAPDGRAYVLDWQNHRVRRVNLDDTFETVVGTDDVGDTARQGWGAFGRLTSTLFANAVLAPTSGLVLSAQALHQLSEAGWLQGRELRLNEIREIAGTVRVLSGHLSQYRSATPAGFETKRRMSATVLIPAHNEEAWIGETLRSITLQTVQPHEVIVVDDCSTDRTGDIARHHGATVLRTPTNRLKAGAQNYGIEHIHTEAVITLDADTVLHPEAIDYLLRDLEAGDDATNGAVLPQSVRGLWSRARLIEYAVALRLHKRAQHSLGSILVLSGCVAAFRVGVMRAVGGFQERTLTEDLDLTWTLHLSGYRVGYAPKAMSYPTEPTSWRLYKGQMRRWAGGFYQSVSAHRHDLRKHGSLALIVAAALWDIVASMLVLVAIVVLAFVRGFTLGPELVVGTLTIVLGIPFVLASSVVGVRQAALAMPAYLVGTWTGQYFYVEAFIREWVLRRSERTWIKGH
jgi:biofilm PGA synthesis N-glycosyltransferase PgaC